MRIELSSVKTALPVFLAAFAFCAGSASAQNSPRVFVTDSTSWEVGGGGGGAEGVWGAQSGGGARPQTAEIVKTFGDRCPNVVVNNKRGMADYIVQLDHEGGKSIFQHRNKVAVFNAVSGDSILSKSTYSLGASVQEACTAITQHWSAHGAELREATARARENAQAASAGTAPTPAAAPQVVRVSVSSTPDGADIEVDGSFAGNTPSTIELPPGEHSVTVTKAGCKPWTRKIKLSGGEVRLIAELEKGS